MRQMIAVAVTVLLISCKSSGPTIPSPGSLVPVQTNTITITSAGADPRNIEIAAGTRVLFVNNDSRSHNMASDPHPDHTDCPSINQVGFLSAGQSRETGNLNVLRTCAYHDHDNPGAAQLQGIITIK